jgi:predicted PurR-regulated permease PerM
MPRSPDGNPTLRPAASRAEHNNSVAELHTGSDRAPFAPPGTPISHRSPFFIGMAAAAGIAVVAGCVELILVARDALVLIGLALFIAIGLEPAVAWFVRHKLRRWAAVTLVTAGSLSLILGFLAAVIPPLVAQGTTFASRAPAYLQGMWNRNAVVAKLNERFHLQQSLDQMFNGGTTNIVHGVLGAGAIVFNAVASIVAVVVLTVYFLASFPQLRSTLYRLIPRSRRPRAILIGDRIFAQVGAYVLGNVIVSLIAGFLTFIWLLIFGVPYALLLAIMVALLDLIPVIGSTVAGAIVCLVALTVSLPVTLATAAFFVCYRLLEDYLLFPKIIGRVVDVPSVVTVVAILLGGVIFGIIGALVAIPIAAAILLIMQEILLPRLDRA